MKNRTLGSGERLADHFVSYLFDQFKGTRHVRRISTWLGFLLKAVERLPSVEVRVSRVRQVLFVYRDRNFKARYNHKAGTRGGIDIVEVLSGRGQPDGAVVLQVTNLNEAERAYRGDLRRKLDRFVADGERE